MTGEQAVALVCAFAAGVAARDISQDYREARSLPGAIKAAAIDPVAASRPPFQFPLCQGGGWVASCADGRECRYHCLPTLTY